MNRMLAPSRWAALALGLCLALPAEAHRAWLLPSATIFSDTGSWVTVDAAVSNDLFYFEHFPMRLEGIGEEPTGMPERRPGGGEGAGAPGATGAIAQPKGDAGAPPAGGGPRRGGPRQALTITGPDGAAIAPQNGAMGRYRSTFDVPLEKPGTYRLAVVSGGLTASYNLGSEKKRWRGRDAAAMKKEIPAEATEVQVTEQQRRIETFLTVGKPTTDILKPTGKGIEFDPLTHPNDLYAEEAAKFRLLVDGKPAAGAKVSVVPGGIRYRDKLGEIITTTNAEGVFEVTWPEAGMYWLEAEVEDDAGAEGAKRRSSYVATLEVQKP